MLVATPPTPSLPNTRKGGGGFVAGTSLTSPSPFTGGGRGGGGRWGGFFWGPGGGGLLNDRFLVAHTVFWSPLTRPFSSLNPPGALLLFGYDGFPAGDAPPPEELPTGDRAPASKKSLI